MVLSSVPGGIEPVAVQAPGCMGRPRRAEPETLTLTADSTDSQPAEERSFIIIHITDLTEETAWSLCDSCRSDEFWGLI